MSTFCRRALWQDSFIRLLKMAGYTYIEMVNSLCFIPLRLFAYKYERTIKAQPLIEIDHHLIGDLKAVVERVLIFLN